MSKPYDSDINADESSDLHANDSVPESDPQPKPKDNTHTAALSDQDVLTLVKHVDDIHTIAYNTYYMEAFALSFIMVCAFALVLISALRR
ncbi:hypothetical protein [Peptococcus niger]|uniref:Uncharacterized protein n=1 Tax=Peptococcus niger TaxID=2741 RepID=A0A1G6S477_PEPNI|nr:hypothetical protein [Peptococcus niger]SDD11659.1 hypothetical protein SAMN04489866_101221 [Peptococcus niger]